MAKKKKTTNKVSVENFKHDSAKRKNIPTAKMAGEGKIPHMEKVNYGYSAHLSPELRFDTSGQSDRVIQIVEKATSGKKLTSEETAILRELAANASQPWLEWSGKKEEHDRGILEVEPVALHIHERVSANAIIRVAKREDIQADLFADPQQEYKEAVQFYMHDVDWANRLILGDNLEVISSLIRREELAEKAQMIYIDPPYGISYLSNFQPEIHNKDVGNTENDITRETETIKAYRDTWKLGVHSYLSYLRDRLIVSRDILAETGSIFVQIGDENVHLVREILDDVFGRSNFISQITFEKTGGLTSTFLKNTCDFILWYAKDKDKATYRPILKPKIVGGEGASKYTSLLMQDGSMRTLTKEEKLNPQIIPEEDRVYRLSTTTSEANKIQEITVDRGCWKGRYKTSVDGMKRLFKAERLEPSKSILNYIRFINDFPGNELNNVWSDIGGIQSRSDPKVYAVQTANKAIERCMLMTTDPGDLVIDPTCGSGTTAFVAENWGRRWITIDSSRVAISIARQRLLTGSFDRYAIQGEDDVEKINMDPKSGIDPSANFIYKTVPHVTLGSIARNENLDSIFEKHDLKLNNLLTEVNLALEDVNEEIIINMVCKLAEKMQLDGIRSATVSDLRRWLLPGTRKENIQDAFRGKSRLKKNHIEKYYKMVPQNCKFEHWNIPYNTDSDWPDNLAIAVKTFRSAWHDKMVEINACISANAERETLVDQPELLEDVLRVTGPFTIEGVQPEELSIDENGELFDPTPNEWEINDVAGDYAQNASAYIDRMLQLIQKDGVTFPNNEHRDFAYIERLEATDSTLHAEALWDGADKDEICNIAIAFGPQHGPVTAEQVEDLIRASRRYDELVIAGFSFDGAAQAVIQESANPRLKIHMAHIRPDVSPGMDGLLIDSPKSQLFTVFGQPEITVRSAKDEENDKFEVELLGVDIYSPLTGEITSSGADKVAAWFLDSDYDGRCFCITQAFFPNQKAWDKIANALGSTADAEAFAAYDGTISVPFEPGQHQRIAVKVIDPRGNEVMAIRSLRESS